MISQKSDLQVDIARWPGCQMPRTELTAALMFLAHKAEKSVRCTPYRGCLRYAAGRVNVYICTTEACTEPRPVWRVKLAGRFHDVHAGQSTFVSVQDLPGQVIRDQEGRVLAKVDHNCLIIPIEITAVDNEAGKAILSHVVEKAAPLLDFDVADKLEEQEAEVAKHYAEFQASAIRARIETKADEVQRLRREATDLYYRLVNVERELPLADEELDFLREQATKQGTPFVQQQATGVQALLAEGLYDEVTPSPKGSLIARTGCILIEHNDWVFELGPYEISIDPAGRVTVLSPEGTQAEGYSHPHVDSNGRPCFGNISADLAKAIGRMRIAEALTLLHDFLSSYNHEGAFVRIGKFDPDYDDPDEDPCEDCQEYHSPYCICECSHNEGLFCCADCGEYRTDYCYQECSYNVPGFQYVSPCDDCEESEEHCFLECQYNAEWQVNSPCNECEKKECEGCKYAAKKRELAERKQSAPVT